MRKQDEYRLTEHESGFALRELRRGRMMGYHLATSEYPLVCYAPKHPEDRATWMATPTPDKPFQSRSVTTDECDAIIWRNIRWFMREKGIGIQEVAEKFNRHRNTVSEWLTRPSSLTSEQVSSLCDLLGVSISQLVWRHSTDPDQSRPYSPEQLADVYKCLTEKHRKMISEMAWELFDSECSHAELISQTERFAETIKPSD